VRKKPLVRLPQPPQVSLPQLLPVLPVLPVLPNRGDAKWRLKKRKKESTMSIDRAVHQDSRWYKRRKAHLAGNPWCATCQAMGLKTPATVADHIMVARDVVDLLEGPLQPMCATHHQSVKRRLEAMFTSGKCTVADLRADSPLALKLADEGPLPPEWRGCDRNGMPKDPRHPWHRKSPGGDVKC
jgi:hypothetical protein